MFESHCESLDKTTYFYDIKKDSRFLSKTLIQMHTISYAIDNLELYLFWKSICLK